MTKDEQEIYDDFIVKQFELVRPGLDGMEEKKAFEMLLLYAVMHARNHGVSAREVARRLNDIAISIIEKEKPWDIRGAPTGDNK